MKFPKSIFISCFLLFGCLFEAISQTPEALPIDPKVRYGKLDNGLTYYIRHNEYPKNQADFYIAQNVGSILEDDNQRGLAHFLEHMAFNGTTHYPGKSMLNYLESIGVKFGDNVNAYTSIDETVYNLSNVPVTRQSTVDSCLLILRDWSTGIVLEEKEIDNERGVIKEEWRSRSSAMMRIYDSIVPVMYEGSKYAHRMPIGTMDVVENFPYQTIRDYYHKWYRPDLQGIIVVGDINVDLVEKEITKLFGSIKLPENPAERTYFTVPDNKEPIVAIAKDKEAAVSNVLMFFKHDQMPKELKATAAGLLKNYINSVASIMLNARLHEMTQKPNAPFLNAYAYDDNFFLSKTKDAFTAYAVTKEDGIKNAINALYGELEKVNRFGFTETEYERAKADYMQNAENLYKERDKQKNETYVQEYVSHFTDGGSISGIESEYNILNQIIPTVTLEQINKYIQGLIGDENLVLAVSGPDKEGLIYPTREELLDEIKKVRNEELTAYVDNVSTEPLIAELPQPGKVIKESHDKRFDATIWKLSNGAMVVIKPTDFKDDEISMVASSQGGSSQFQSKDILDYKTMNSFIPLGGIGNFSITELNKILAGKKVSVNASVQEKSENISAQSTPKDLETMMQLVYLNFTAPRKDSEAFEAARERMRSSLLNRDANPNVALNDTIVSAVYMNDIKRQSIKLNDIDKLDYDNMLKLYKNRFEDASDFVFTFVGNVNTDSLRPLVEQYIASLPVTHRKEKGKSETIIREGIYQNHFEKSSETPKSTVFIVYSGKCKYSLENEIRMEMLSHIMDLIYTETIREEEGGTYGVGTAGKLIKDDHKAIFLFTFDTNNEKSAQLMQRAKDELQKFAKEGTTAANFSKVKEYFLKTQKEKIKENNYWLGLVNSYYFDGTDNYTEYEKLVKKQTPESIRKFAETLLKQDNVTEVVMTGVKK